MTLDTYDNLRRHIGKPMVHNDDGHEEFARCECGAVLVTTYGNRHKYCSNCGRKVDWSGEDD